MPVTAVRSSSSATSSTEQRACDAADCRTGKLINKVAKRKTAQFITKPSIQEKPVLVSGLTSVFQVDGMAATLSDIKPISGEIDKIQPVYCIKQDSHVHIINYIVVDDDSDVLRKITENDADTMRILVESQRVSAEAKLRKLMANHDTMTQRVVAKTLSVAASKEQGTGTTQTVTTSAPQATVTTKSLSAASARRPAGTSVNATAGNANTSTSTAQTTGLGLSIASVSERVAFQAPAAPPTIDKLQEELEALRRTVAKLAAQAN